METALAKSDSRNASQAQLDDNRFDQTFFQDVIEGLNSRQKQLSPKYFYDERGSQYFDDICNLREYYLYQSELTLLPKVADELSSMFQGNLNVVEFGAGSLVKIQPLLDAVKNIKHYMPIDISAEWLAEACRALGEKYPRIAMHPIVADFTMPVPVPETSAKPFGFFPGSTIGNLLPDEALSFLIAARKSLGNNSYLLIGVDTKKSTEVLHKAYNDNKGVTAKFNLNILQRINRELNGDFDLRKFEHYAFYNVQVGRVEMHLVSTEDQQCSIAGETIAFQQGESIHTESSYKYTPQEFQDLSTRAGWSTKKLWMADNDMFSIYLLHA